MVPFFFQGLGKISFKFYLYNFRRRFPNRCGVKFILAPQVNFLVTIFRIFVWRFRNSGVALGNLGVATRILGRHKLIIMLKRIILKSTIKKDWGTSKSGVALRNLGVAPKLSEKAAPHLTPLHDPDIFTSMLNAIA